MLKPIRDIIGYETVEGIELAGGAADLTIPADVEVFESTDPRIGVENLVSTFVEALAQARELAAPAADARHDPAA